MSCNCFEKATDALKKQYGGAASFDNEGFFTAGGPLRSGIVLPFSYTESTKNGKSVKKKKGLMSPSHCCFCGEKIQ